ncbi:MAG: sigma-70 family RNA polymerase sigma factor [Firmicutes bacterium]|nr:sigma-70 family RNA polymerase sigma factor [Bacillota bacterium]
MECDDKKRMLMKKRLELWGSAHEICVKRQEEIKRVKRLIKQAGDIKGRSFSGLPKSGVVSDPTYKAVELIIDEYEKEISDAAEAVEKIMQEKNIMDSYIEKLSPKEAKIIFYKYRKKVSPDSLAILMNVSRSHSYRMLNNTIDKLVELAG